MAEKGCLKDKKFHNLECENLFTNSINQSSPLINYHGLSYNDQELTNNNNPLKEGINITSYIGESEIFLKLPSAIPGTKSIYVQSKLVDYYDGGGGPYGKLIFKCINNTN